MISRKITCVSKDFCKLHRGKAGGDSLCCDHNWPIFQLTWWWDHNAEGLFQTWRTLFRCHELVRNFLMETKSRSWWSFRLRSQFYWKSNGGSSKLRFIFNNHLIQMRWNNWEQRSSRVSSQSEQHHWLWLNHQPLVVQSLTGSGLYGFTGGHEGVCVWLLSSVQYLVLLIIMVIRSDVPEHLFVSPNTINPTFYVIYS